MGTSNCNCSCQNDKILDNISNVSDEFVYPEFQKILRLQTLKQLKQSQENENIGVEAEEFNFNFPQQTIQNEIIFKRSNSSLFEKISCASTSKSNQLTFTSNSHHIENNEVIF